MKQKLLTLFLALAASVAPLFAQSGTCGDNLTWTLSDGVLTISGTGAMKNYTYYTGSPWYSYCSSIKTVTMGNGVTSIGNFAFDNCSSLTSVTIPNSVTSIGDYAFRYCSTLTSITIPNSVTSIGERAFSNCSGLTSVTIPNSVTSIGSSAFSGCSSLPVIDGIRYADTYLVEAVDKTLTTYTIKEGTKWIRGSAFVGCSSLTSITIPNSVTSIGSSAFKDCSSLTSPIFNAHVFAKMPQSYSGSYTIPDGIESIAGGAFEDCSKLTSITIPNSVTSIGSSAFEDCSGLTSVTIGNSVTSIGKSAFYRCSGLTSVTIGNSVTSIENYAFYSCSGLTSVIIPNSVTFIGYDAFYHCDNLIFVELSSNLEKISDGAFGFCPKLDVVILNRETPPSRWVDGVYDRNNIFIGTSTNIYVPKSSVNTYLNNSNWNTENILPLYMYSTTNAYPTSIIVEYGYYKEDAQFILSCGIEGGEEFVGNTAEYIGLEPESEYADVPFFVKTKEGDYDNIKATFKTTALTLTTLASKAVSNTTSILLAETNMSDAETSCGFEWRRNDQPADMPSNQVLCPVANGLMAGRLKGLKDDVYYKYRAFYKSAAGNMYYGDWQYVFTGDVTVEFDPVLYTYAAQFVSERKATLKGYALAGSDDFTEQGFEYWAESRRTDAPARRAPQYAIGEKHTVTGTGISMRVTLEDLDEGTVYKYRTYAKVGGKTLYGSEMTFTTQGTYEDPIETDLDLMPDADADSLTPSPHTPQARKYIRNGILYIEHNGITYTAQGHRID